MTTADIKLELFRKLDSLDDRKIKHLYGEFLNLINRESTFEDWDLLPEEQRMGIEEAELQYKAGKFQTQEMVMGLLGNRKHNG